MTVSSWKDNILKDLENFLWRMQMLHQPGQHTLCRLHRNQITHLPPSVDRSFATAAIWIHQQTATSRYGHVRSYDAQIEMTVYASRIISHTLFISRCQSKTLFLFTQYVCVWQPPRQLCFLFDVIFKVIITTPQDSMMREWDRIGPMRTMSRSYLKFKRHRKNLELSLNYGKSKRDNVI